MIRQVQIYTTSLSLLINLKLLRISQVINKPLKRLKSKFKSVKQIQSSKITQINPSKEIKIIDLSIPKTISKTMYRPQSQIIRQRSMDKKELHSKARKPSKKDYAQYVRKMISNTPNHIDSDRRLKIQNSQQANRCQIRERIQKKMGQDDKDMFRSAVVRFIKPKINQRDYRRFKKLFEIFNKIQKMRNEITTINCSSTRYIKDLNTFYQNERLKELNQHMYKLQLDEEKILMEIQNEGKENLQRVFSQDKGNNHVKQPYLMEKNIDYNANTNVENEKLLRNQKSGEKAEFIQTMKKQKDHCPSSHKRKQSSISKQSNIQTEQIFLNKLYELVWSLESQIKSNSSPDKKKFNQTKSNESMYEEIKGFMVTKHKSIDEIFRKLVNLRRINHKDSQIEESGIKYSEQIHKPYEQVYKSGIQNQFGKFHELDQKTKASTKTQSNTKQSSNSFNSLLSQMQSDLTQLKQITVIKDRNSQLAKQLLTVSKELKKCEQEKISLEKQLKQKKQDDELIHIIKKENELMVRKNQKLDQDNTKLINQIGRMKDEIDQLREESKQLRQEVGKLHKENKENQNKQSKENSKYEKYYRESLSLQQQVKILSEQNQKLVHELNSFRQRHQSFKQRHQSQKEHQQQAVPQTQQKKLIKQKQPSTSLSHQKSAKQSSSLMFKQLQKKNKKLTQENLKLSNQVSEINSKINQLQKSNQTLLQKVQKMTDQNNRMKEDSNFLEQENNVLLEENKKIQEGFQYIVKEKLQLETSLTNKVKENLKLLSEKDKLITYFRQNMSQIQQTVLELKEHKQSLMRELSHMREATMEMFSCLNQQITSALDIFINNFNVQTQQQQQSPQQKIIQQQILLPQNQQALNNLTQQCQSLMDELNHCVYELNTYKAMLDQVQIEKELQKKYLEQDIAELNAKLLLVEKENARVKLENTELNKNIINTKANQQFSTQQTQTLYVSHLCEVSSCQLSFMYIPQSQPIDRNLKINCESFSINIPPLQPLTSPQLITQQKSLQTSSISLVENFTYSNVLELTICPDPIEEPISQQHLTLESWFQQVSLSSQTPAFKQFCQVNLTRPSSFLTQNSQNAINSLREQNLKLKQEIQKLTLNQGRSPIKDILSPNDKMYNCFENTKDQADQSIQVMGSLYNRFSFPKLQNHQGKDDKMSNNENLDHHKKVDHQSIREYPPLQQQPKIRQSLVQKFNLQPNHSSFPKTVDNINRTLNEKENKLPNNFEDEDQSFDLCIA